MKYKLKCVAATKGWFSNGGQLSALGGWGREEIQLLQSFTDYQDTILLMEHWGEPFLPASFADRCWGKYLSELFWITSLLACNFQAEGGELCLNMCSCISPLLDQFKVLQFVLVRKSADNYTGGKLCVELWKLPSTVNRDVLNGSVWNCTILCIA